MMVLCPLCGLGVAMVGVSDTGAMDVTISRREGELTARIYVTRDVGVKHQLIHECDPSDYVAGVVPWSSYPADPRPVFRRLGASAAEVLVRISSYASCLASATTEIGHLELTESQRNGLNSIDALLDEALHVLYDEMR